MAGLLRRAGRASAKNAPLKNSMPYAQDGKGQRESPYDGHSGFRCGRNRRIGFADFKARETVFPSWFYWARM